MREKPNLILILTDQQSASMMSCTGNKWLKTYAMDELAKRGVRFEHAYCTNPVCVPSRISIFTGQYPSFFGVRSNNTKNFYIPSNFMEKTLGGCLLKAEYELYYGGKIHLPEKLHPSKMGFTYFCDDEREKLAVESAKIIKKRHQTPYFLVASFINPHDICYMAIRDFPIDEMSKKLLEKSRLELSILEEALKIPEGISENEFFEKYCPPLPPNHNPQEDEPEAIEIMLKQRPFKWKAREEYTEKKWRLHRWAYCRLTERVDREIQIIIEAIDKTKGWDNTIIIFTSDHGDHDSAHKMEHKTAFYQEAIRIPFIICGPEIEKGIVDHEHLICNGLDILPTFCDYAGTEISSNLKGFSLRTLFKNKNTQWREFLRIESEFGRMVMDKRFKYVRYEIGKNSEQLYDLLIDPGETKNFLNHSDYQDIVIKMKKIFEKEFMDFDLPFVYEKIGLG